MLTRVGKTITQVSKTLTRVSKTITQVSKMLHKATKTITLCSIFTSSWLIIKYKRLYKKTICYFLNSPLTTN
jgi:hypothetical protein